MLNAALSKSCLWPWMSFQLISLLLFGTEGNLDKRLVFHKNTVYFLEVYVGWCAI
jgi:hypothetical protein